MTTTPPGEPGSPTPDPLRTWTPVQPPDQPPAAQLPPEGPAQVAVEPVILPTTGRRSSRPSWPLTLAFLVVAFLGGALVDRALVSGFTLAPVASPAPAASPVPATQAPPGDLAAPTDAAAATPTPTPPTGDEAFKLVRQAWDLLHEKYVARGDLDDQALAHAAIDALAEAVGDTDHTVFMTPSASGGLRCQPVRRVRRHRGAR